ncbi:insulinase family protein [Aliikangiella coralliicola]|uniref:Insulinase family protein n=2 Tax=Aliikangiella coralliicola TaxID=2592383 RepID=A0A545UDA6_9GAMM|nr:insulinase family protein [Aliikangiella coralliicola]
MKNAIGIGGEKASLFRKGLSLCLLAGMISSCTTVNNTTASANVSSKQSNNAAAEKIFNLPYHMETLENGLKVIVVKTDYPDLVSLQIPMQTGSRNEVEPGKSGFAHFFEHMMFKGTKNFPQAEYSKILKNAGVDGNAYTSDDLTNYHISFPKEHLEKMLMLEADRFQNLFYTEAEFRTEALAVKGEYLKNSSSPFRKMFEGIRDLAFKQHTYKHTTMGFLRDIEDMPNQFDYSKTFFKRWYTPQFASVIVVGDVDVNKTVDWVKKYWGVWKTQKTEVSIPKEPPQEKQIYQHLQFEKTPNTYITMAFRGPALDENKKDKPSLDLLSEAYFSESSDLYRDLVIDRQMVQFVGAYFPDRKDPQLLYIYTQLKDEKYAEEVKQAITKTLIRARTELLDEKRLNDIKNNLKYSFARTLDSTDSIASTLASYVHFERDPEFLNRLYRTFAKITPQDIKRYATTYFTDDNLTMVTMSPKAALAKFDGRVDLDRASKNTHQPNVQIKTLLQPTSSDLIDISWWFNTGTAQDPQGKKGLAALTAMMIADGGTVSRTYNDIQQAMYPLAGRFGFRVDKEIFIFNGSVHRDNLAQWYGLVSEQMLQPGWREEDFKRLKDQLINNIENSLKSSNDEELGKEVLYEALYAGHSYGALNSGHVDDIKKLTLNDVKDFYQTQLTQNNLTLAIAGNYPKTFKNKIVSDMAKLPQWKKMPSTIAAAPKLKGRHATIVEKNTLSTAVSFGFPIDVKRGDEDWVALWLVRSWLGEHRNSNSYLYQRIRALRGMNYGDYAYIEYFPSGMFTTKPVVNVPRSQQIFQVWIRPLRSANDAHFATRTAMWEMEKLIKNGLTQEQFESTKNFLRNYVPQLVDSQSRILGYAVDSKFYDTEGFVDYVRKGLDQLTLDKVNQVIKKHLQLENMHFVFITKDAKDMKKRLAEEQNSPMKYNSEKPAEIVSEDKIIAKYPLKIDSKNIEIKSIESVFK